MLYYYYYIYYSTIVLYYYIFKMQQIVVATPGRLCEFVFDHQRLKLTSVRFLVLDEVDALLRTPYDREVDAIVEAIPSGGFVDHDLHLVDHVLRLVDHACSSEQNN